MGANLFLSHASADLAAAKRLVAALEQAGYRLWWDGMLQGGEAFQTSIEAALERADAVVVLWSAVANDSHWVRDEAAVARDRGRLVPLSLDGVLPPLGFRQVQTIDVSGWNGRTEAPEFQRVLAAVAGVSGKPVPVRPPPAAAPAAASGINRRWLLAGGGVAAVAVAGVAGWRLLTPAADNPTGSIAVLPFRNLSGRASDDYFAEGLAEELRTTLSLNRQLLVSGAASAGGFRESAADPRQIARALGVSSLLLGAVRPAGDRVRITARLVDGTNGLERWSESFDRKLADVLAVQAEIATSVADSLLSSLLQDGGWRAQRPGGTGNAKAFDAYIKGQALYQASASTDGDRAALAAFDAALAADPGYAAAHAARARCLTSIANMDPDPAGTASRRAQALASARKAIALAPDMAEGHAALGFILMGQLDLAGARDPYQRSFELGLGNAPILASYAEFAANMGDFAPAADAAARARRLDPLNPGVFRSAGLVAFGARDYAAARAPLESALSLNPKAGVVHRLLGDMALAQGDPASARAHYAQEPSTASRLRGLAVADARLNGRAAGELHMQALIKAYGDAALFQQAEVLAQWGEGDKAMAALEQALALRDSGLVLARNDPLLDPLRERPAFQALLRRIGLTA